MLVNFQLSWGFREELEKLYQQQQMPDPGWKTKKFPSVTTWKNGSEKKKKRRPPSKHLDHLISNQGSEELVESLIIICSREKESRIVQKIDQETVIIQLFCSTFNERESSANAWYVF